MSVLRLAVEAERFARGGQAVLEHAGWRESAGRLTFDDVMDPSRIPCIDS